MAIELGAPPILSTPDSRILEQTSVATILRPEKRLEKRLSDEELSTRYEIQRTVLEIRQRKLRRVALQFPDEMLPDSARVFQLLARGLSLPKVETHQPLVPLNTHEAEVGEGFDALDLDDSTEPVKLTILADTSYGACCVDEIAAEHVDADAVVHYGRACLSPTARLPVVYVFTKWQLDLSKVVECFKETFSDRSSKVLIMADVTYAEHVPLLCDALAKEGYLNLVATAIIHDPSSPVPNRTVPDSVGGNPESLRDWQLFHISEPPTSLLLTLSSRVAAIHVYSTQEIDGSEPQKPLLASTSLVLRRRYALVTSLATVPIWGILINTLSVKNYLHMVDHVRGKIAAAGKKSYLFVVGKLNAAKVANFSEIGGWVVIGCWESSLVDSKDFYRPVITPFELELALTRDEDRLWTGQWRGDFQTILDQTVTNSEQADAHVNGDGSSHLESVDNHLGGDYDSEEESAPPEFDLRTGRYVSQTRPMLAQQGSITTTFRANQGYHSTALARRAKGDMTTVNGVASPGAEHLRTKRTWQGLGSDFEIAYEEEGEEESSAIQEGRTGIACGYTVANSGKT
jgi:diphthamide biosynthesis protein 2